MKIVQLANFFSPTSGGLRTCLDALSEGYEEAGHEVVRIVPGSAYAEDGRTLTLPGVRVPGQPYRVMLDVRRVVRVLDGLEPGRVEVNDRTTLVGVGHWARMAGIPAVAVVHERVDAILAPRVPSWFPLRRLADAVNRRMVAAFDTIVCPSAFAAEEVRRVGGDVDVRIVPLGVDLATFVPETHAMNRDLVLVTVGRLSTEKRPDLALDTLAALRRLGAPAVLIVAGDGPLRTRLEDRARREHLPVQFVGHVADRVALAKLIAKTGIALAPCPCESFGLAVIEAMACGTPVVVPPTGAPAERLRAGVPGCGTIAAGTNGPALAAAVLALAAQSVAVRRAAARATAERFPWSATVAAMLDLHETSPLRMSA